MISNSTGFHEVDHTADWELEVWAPDLPALLEQAARGMYHLTAVHLDAKPRLSRCIQLQAADPESLLVAFLDELRYLGETERLAFDLFDISITDLTLTAHLSGAPFATQAKEIKAITYHNLMVRNTVRGLEVNIVFDV